MTTLIPKYDQSSTGAVNRPFNLKLNEIVSVMDFGATGDGSTDDTSAIQAAINSFGGNGGTVFFPVGNYKTTVALSMVANVSLVGSGANSSIIKPVACHGVEFTYSNGFQYTLISEIGFDGTNATTYTAIHQTPPANFSTEIYGINVKDVYVTYFDTAIYLSSARNIIIDNCWFESVNNGIILVGNTIDTNITNNWIVCTGSGSTKYGVYINGYTFSVSGYRRPEHVLIHGNQLYGCTSAVYIYDGLYVDVIAADIYASQYGVYFSTIAGNLNVKDSYIEMAGNNSVGILGAGESSPLTGNANSFENNYFICSSGTSTIGISIGVYGTSNQFWNRIVGNSFTAFTGYDIAVYSSAYLTILDNKCFSTTTTYSIYINGGIYGLVFIDKNYCDKDIYQDINTYSDINYVLGINTVNSNTTNYGKEALISGAPTTGTWSLGARFYNSSPTSGGYVGWVCTSAGTPGTWKTFGLIS